MSSRWIYRLAGLLAVIASSMAQSQETLRVLTWPGYADADLVKAFEVRHSVNVDITYITTDEALWAKLSEDGQQFDLFAANTAELHRAIAQDISLPLQLDQIPNTRQQTARFRDLHAIPGITQDGKVYAIPYTYAEMGLIYNRQLINVPPTSITALWDPQYRGKVLAYDGSSHNFSLAAQTLGLPNPFHIPESEWNNAAKKLVELRRNILTFYTQPEEVVQWYKKQSVALVFANYGNQQVKMLRDAGADIGYVIPKEGALAWLDCWSVLKTTRQRQLAHAWIDFMLEPEAANALTERQGLNNTLQMAPADQKQPQLIWLQPVENIDRRTTLWNSIRSGDSL